MATYSESLGIFEDMKQLNKSRIGYYQEAMDSTELSLEMRSKFTQQTASNFYVYEGRVVKFINEQGQKVDYVPTQEDIEIRQRTNSLIESFKDLSRASKNAIVIDIVVLLLSILTGWFSVRLAPMYQQLLGKKQAQPKIRS